MCIGAVVQIIESREFTALCKGRHGMEEVNMMLIGQQPVGTWLVNFLGSARDILSPEDAHNINLAMDELEQVMQAS